MNDHNHVATIGCRLNIFESEVIKQNLAKSGMTNKVVVNTCCVTSKAEKESLQTIKKLKQKYPDKDIIVTGCAVHSALNKLQNMKEVDTIVPNSHKLLASALKAKQYDLITNQEAIINNETNFPKIKDFSNKTRAFIQIQQGCDHRCSFCIIHRARGKSYSLPEREIIEQIQTVVQNGHQEVILTGVDISSWQRDIFSSDSSKIGELCFKILKDIKDLKRLRLSSLDPAVTDVNILKLLANEDRFMPHIHLSLQSMNTRVLNNMGRRHSRESALEWIDELRNANKKITIGADIICGFPQETDQQFLETKQTLSDININFLHVFPYSERSGTPAEKMKQIPMAIRKERTLDLIATVANINKLKLFQSKVNQTEEVLVEADNKGYTKDYCLVRLVNQETIRKNSIINLKIIGYETDHLIGELV